MTWGDFLWAAALGLTLSGAAAAQQAAQEPLSAIDWLDQSPPAPEPPVADHVSIPEVAVTPLGDTARGAVGLLPTSVTGLPADLWQGSDGGDLTALWRRVGNAPPPAIRALYHTLLLAEAEPPRGDADAYLLERIAVLRHFGAVEPARELLARAGPERPALFGAWFELSLLDGRQSAACTTLRETPSLLDDKAAQIYCAALTGDWPTAVLIFDTSRALGLLNERRATLLDLFLDADKAETTPPPRSRAHPTALDFRLREAIGSPLSTRDLPPAFAMADLGGSAGWKAEIEAAERLTRAGTLAPGRLLGLYTRRSPAASGGVWNRVKAVQKLETALKAGASDDIAPALQGAWRQMRDAGLALPFAQMLGIEVNAAGLSGEARTLAFRMALLTPEYEDAAADPPSGRRARFLAGLARGQPDPDLADGTRARMVATAFGPEPEAAPDHARLIRQGKLGEAILSAALQFDRADGDPGEMAEALGTLRAVGLEDTARRAALQALILTDDP